ncbi:hypothetical protein PAMP_014696 [Pampus punctatissimus]
MDGNATLADLGETGTVSSLQGSPPVSPHTATPVVKKTPEKTLQLTTPPEYVIYTDSELELSRKQHFEMALTGRDGESSMSKELRCRLMSMYRYLQKQILNVKSPQKRQQPRPGRSSSTKIRHIDFSPSDQGEDYDADSSGGSTILLPPESCSEGDSSVDKDSLATQARLYKTLQEMYKKPKPNQDAVCQILDLEFQARRAFIDCDILKEEDRPAKIFEAYPCFRELHHVMDELRRILDKDNSKFISEVKKRWADFCSMVQFYGVWRKVLKPPMSLGPVESNIALYRALPTLFPSQSALPKKMGQASEALLHVLQPTEEPAIYLQKRTLFSPVLVFDGSRCLLAIGNTPVTTFAKEELGEGLLYLMGYYYTLHLTYPKCVATLLSVIQTEVLQDSIHERDTTDLYKRSMAEWNAFINK